ncbi:MAG: hypothetical protein JW797_15435 [Bradymonadales bacterium]|nr:hypothetical protein [Bradymonadales bacterium]
MNVKQDIDSPGTSSQGEPDGKRSEPLEVSSADDLDGWVCESNRCDPWPLWISLSLLPLLVLWTLPQTLVGLVLALVRKAQGSAIHRVRFGPFLFLVSPGGSIGGGGISLGLVVLADTPTLLTHEFCHLYTGLWLSWLYLPVYGLEYLILGHHRSYHERATCWFERRNRRSWWRI